MYGGSATPDSDPGRNQMSPASSQGMDMHDRFRRRQVDRAQGLSSEPGSLSIPFLYVLNLAGYAGFSFLPDVLGVPSEWMSIPFHALVVVISSFLTLNGIRNHRLKLGRPGIYFLLFWALYLTRLYVDTLIRPISLARPANVYWSFSVGIIIIPCIALFLRPRIKDLDTALIALQAAFLVIALASLRYGMSMLAFQIDGRLTGNSTQNSVQLGHLGAAMVICGGFSLIAGRSSQVLWSRVLNYASVACGMIVLFLCGSRGPLVAFATVIAFWVIGSVRSRFSRKRQFIAVVCLSLVIAASLYVVTRSQGSLFARVGHLETADDRESELRTSLWSMGWQDFLDNPLCGRAVDLVDPVDGAVIGYPHNFVLESFMATGVFGGLLFTGLFMYGILRTLRLVRSTHPAAWVGLLYIQYAMAGVFSGTIYDNFHFWYMYAALSVIPLVESKCLMPQRHLQIATD